MGKPVLKVVQPMVCCPTCETKMTLIEMNTGLRPWCPTCKKVWNPKKLYPVNPKEGRFYGANFERSRAVISEAETVPEMQQRKSKPVD